LPKFESNFVEKYMSHVDLGSDPKAAWSGAGIHLHGGYSVEYAFTPGFDVEPSVADRLGIGEDILNRYPFHLYMVIQEDGTHRWMVRWQGAAPPGINTKPDLLGLTTDIGTAPLLNIDLSPRVWRTYQDGMDGPADEERDTYEQGQDGRRSPARGRLLALSRRFTHSSQSAEQEVIATAMPEDWKDSVERRLDRVEKENGTLLNRGIAAVVVVAGLVAGQYFYFNDRFDKVSDRLTQVEVKLGKVEVKIDNLDYKIDNIDKKLERLLDQTKPSK